MCIPEKPPAVDRRYVIFGTLFQLSNKLDTIGTRMLDDLTAKQWFLLATLSSLCAIPPTIGETALLMSTSHQNVKQLALKLQEKGFLRIEKDARDSRALRLVLTPKLQAYDAEHHEAHHAFIEQLYDGFSEQEIYTLLRAIFRLNDNLDAIQKTLSNTPHGGNQDEPS